MSKPSKGTQDFILSFLINNSTSFFLVIDIESFHGLVLGFLGFYLGHVFEVLLVGGPLIVCGHFVKD